MLRTPALKLHHFRRQVEIGPYYADFASLRARLVIEVDGSQHFAEDALAHDAQRDAFIRSLGYRILRVTASDVLNRIDGVHEAIRGALPNISDSVSPPTAPQRGPPSPPSRRGGSGILR